MLCWQVKTLEDFNLDHLPSLRRDVLAHLPTGTFIACAENVILLGPPGLGKTAIGLGVKAAHAGYSVLFDTANNWIIRRPRPLRPPRGLTPQPKVDPPTPQLTRS
jgi:DNA replication protein DnaC